MPVYSNRRLTRRSSSPFVRELDPLSENSFWQQVQSFLGSYLKKTEYDEDLYVPFKKGVNTADRDIDDFVKAKDLTCYLLIGQYGVGKTSALKHYHNLNIKKKGEFDCGLVWIYIDIENHAAELMKQPMLLNSVIMNHSAKTLMRYLKYCKQTTEDFLIDTYKNDIYFEGQRLLNNTKKRNIDKVKYILSEQPEHYLVSILNYLRRNVGNGKVILVLDNVDGFPQELQIDTVHTVSRLARECEIKGIVAVRRATAFELKHSDPKLLGVFVQNEIAPPKISLVIQKRVEKALEQPQAKNAKLGEGALIFSIRDCPEFSEIIAKGLSSPQVERLIEGLSNNSVQDALRYSMKVYSSHFIDAHRIIRKLSPPETILPTLWKGHFPYHIVLKSILLCNRPAYLPDASLIGNLFGTTHSSSDFGPFLRTYILTYFAWYHFESIDIEKTVKDLKLILEADEVIIKEELDWLSNENWIEKRKGNEFGITKLGSFIIGELIYDIEYLTHIAVDVDIYEELEAKLSVPADTPKERMNNLLCLIEYLVKSELIALANITKHGLAKFTRIYGTIGFTPRITRSVLKALTAVKSGTVNYDIGDTIDTTIHSLDAFEPLVQKINKMLKPDI